MASLLHTLLHGRANVSAANEHEQAGFRGQVADASRNARFGERPTIASLPIVTALRSPGTRYPPCGAASECSAFSSWGVQNRLIWRSRTGVAVAGCSLVPENKRGRIPLRQ